MVEVTVLDEFEAWFLALPNSDRQAVTRSVDLLEHKGTALGHPYSSAIHGSTIALRELRVQSGGKPLRVFYCFDPSRSAVVIIGGDKTGNDRFYEKMIPAAEELYRAYLSTIRP